MKIHWYPGHMVKTKRQIQETLKQIDLVIEILDARIPISSKNPDIDTLTNGKPKLVIFNKADLAEDKITKAWMNYYKKLNNEAIEIDSISGKNINKVYLASKELVKEKFERKIQKGIVGRPIRALVVGIPNSGKSSFINKISAKSNAKTGDKPGVTRSNQWIKVNNDFELLDTPGILWPKLDDDIVALHLAYARSIRDEILDTEELAIKFLEEMTHLKKQVIIDRYKVEIDENPNKLLLNIGKKRGCVISGGEIDTLRAATLVLDDFRTGKLGRISLEAPNDLLTKVQDDE